MMKDAAEAAFIPPITLNMPLRGHQFPEIGIIFAGCRVFTF
jgi:hypothetical protein